MAETGSPLHLAGTYLGFGAFVEPEATGIPEANAKQREDRGRRRYERARVGRHR